ncbi:MAG: Uma2 family endonuclease [Blastocatellia bacterium]
MTTKARSRIEDLYHLPENGKAEIVDGEILLMPPTGDIPARAGGSVYISLRLHEGKTPGRAYPDNTGFRVSLPNRESFSPDVAWHTGQITGMKFLEGSPVFAVEIRSENDYGPKAEQKMAEKRRDYFAAGTIVIWDVDLLSPDVIKSYNASDPANPQIFRPGDTANAEPAVPGWMLAVDELFS